MVISLVNDTVCAWADWKLCIDFFNVNFFSLINSLCCHGNDCKLKFSRNREYTGEVHYFVNWCFVDLLQTRCSHQISRNCRLL